MLAFFPSPQRYVRISAHPAIDTPMLLGALKISDRKPAIPLESCGGVSGKWNTVSVSGSVDRMFGTEVIVRGARSY